MRGVRSKLHFALHRLNPGELKQLWSALPDTQEKGGDPMFAKLISDGIEGGKPKPGNCFTGEYPQGDCIFRGGIPWGYCDRGYG